MQLDQLIAGLDVRPASGGPASVRVCDITEDSRTVLPGSLFVARAGEKSDGRAYIDDAVRLGAIAVLVQGDAPKDPGVPVLSTPDIRLASAQLAERFYGSPTSKLRLIGVTGTNGKTTITYLIHQLLNGAGVRCGLVGTVCIDDGVETAPALLTTPPSMELSRTFARMVESGCTVAAMETSSHALDQQRVAALRFGVGVYSNLSHDHLDYHGTMDKYAAAKAQLFAMLPEDGLAIINADDAYAPVMLRAARCRVLRCSTRPGHAGGADCWARITAAGPSHTQVELMGPWIDAPLRKPWSVRLPLVGEHNVMNALQAAAAAWGAGLDAERIFRGLGHVTAPPGRLEPVTRPEHPFAVYVDYAHSDDSLVRVLTVLREALTRHAREQGTEPGRLLVVVGCGGDRDRAKRPKMGHAAATLADRAIVTSDNPRTEDPRAIIDEILSGIPAPARTRVSVEPDRRGAIVKAVGELRDRDVLLIAGKGHEDYQILPGPHGTTVKVHFDDREEARLALTQRGVVIEPEPIVASRRPHAVPHTPHRHGPGPGQHPH